MSARVQVPAPSPAPQRASSATPSPQAAVAAAGGLYHVRLVYPPNQVLEGLNDYDQTLKLLVRFRNRIDAHRVGGMEGHKELAKVNDEFPIVSRVSDLFGGTELPSSNIWIQPWAYLMKADVAISRGDIPTAVRDLQKAAELTKEADSAVSAYREGTITGAERAVFGLEVVKVAAATTVSVGTGGTAGLFIGAGYAGAQNLAGQASAVAIGIQDKIDWGGVAFDTFFSLIAGKFGGQIGGRIFGKLLGNPATATLVRKLGAHAITALVVGRGTGIVHSQARALFDAARGKAEMTYETFANRLADQLTLQAAFMDLVGAAAGAGTNKFAEAQAPKSSPPPPPPPPPAKPNLRLVRSEPAPTTPAETLTPAPQPPSKGEPSKSNVTSLQDFRARRSGGGSSGGNDSATTNAPTPMRSTAEPVVRGNTALQSQPQATLAEATSTQPLTRPQLVPAPEPVVQPAPVPAPQSVPSPSSNLTPQTTPNPGVATGTASAINASQAPATAPPGKDGLHPDRALPFVWFKPLHLYPKFLDVPQAVAPKQLDRDVPLQQLHYPFRRGTVVEPVGVKKSNWAYKGKRFQLVPFPRSDVEKDRFAALVQRLGFDATGLQFDHVNEIQFGGADHFRNVWPLDASANMSAGTRHQAQLDAYRAQFGNIFGRYFEIIDIRV